MLALATSAPTFRLPHMASQSVDAPEQKLLGKALGALRRRAGLSQVDAGAEYGITGEGWRKYEAGAAKAIFTPDTQAKLTAAIGFNRQDLLDERARLTGEDPPSSPRQTPADRRTWARARAPELELLPIRDTVQAGAWFLADDHRQDAPASHPVASDPRFPAALQWLSEVRGDSVNMLNIVEGDLVHCVDAIDIGYYPRTGDIVEVERLRFGGQERELTLKQIEVTPSGVLLWPRSSNPRYRDPLEISAGTAEGETYEVRVRALVLAAIRRF